MALSLTVLTVDAAASSGAQSVTIPSNCTSLAIVWTFYEPGTATMSSVSVGSESATININETVGAGFASGYGAAYIDNPSTGTVDVDWAWTGNTGSMDEGGRLYIFCAESSTDSAQFLDAAGNSESGTTNPTPVTVNSDTDSLVVMLAQSYDNGAPHADADVTDQTIVSGFDDQIYNSNAYDVATHDSPGASTTSMEIDNAGVYYSSAVVVSFKEVASGGSTITPSGIASAESLGSPTVSTGAVSISPGGIASAEAVGSPEITPTNTIEISGIASAETFGNPAFEPGSVAIVASAIASAEAFGSAVVSTNAVLVLPSAIASAEAFGSAQLDPGGVFILPDGIGSAEAFGTAVLLSGAVILPASIETMEAFGNPSLAPGEVVILPTGIGTEEAFGVAQVGDVIIAGKHEFVKEMVRHMVRPTTN